ncbi:hypothetical protein V499_00688 [Pseudogymnoascus sp. VKM F-103]|uniref:COP9 signalosome complex subunit 6 n=1 Tax=Pseudogymnoascus verrucosus TaxID=342668 RepID=A0A1B8GN10_9PEZI|nr:uncharacterized protein VE01_04608 [Pseudogymnoascus verrucosus]KFY80450.1 hypothetical protein V499_00688 [Pseudogymnoascus sp. VKM F-103]OBT97225.1 hypothetical protein VE01_04608 [Pseudogymnoascus verrucosus]
MAPTQPNAFLSTQKSDSGLEVALHPLVLLTISDYITRHTLRNQTGPIIGALLGQQNGREVTVEHAFECKVQGGSIDPEWFTTRLQQMKDVHKNPPLDFVGWYTLIASSGPTDYHLAIQETLSNLNGPETPCILLGFLPSESLSKSSNEALPITIYESIAKPADTRAAGQDVEMEQSDSSPKTVFAELPYVIETGEAERIAIDFVARGGGNATAVSSSTQKQTNASEESNKGKKRASDDTAKDIDVNDILSNEETELITALTAKANAVRMLQSRIKIIQKYLELQPPTDATGQPSAPAQTSHLEPSPEILRSIAALISRLPLVVPSSSKDTETDTSKFDHDLLASRNDVNLVSLLDTLTQSIQGTRELGRKFGVVDAARNRTKFQEKVDRQLSMQMPDKVYSQGMMGMMQAGVPMRMDEEYYDA